MVPSSLPRWGEQWRMLLGGLLHGSACFEFSRFLNTVEKQRSLLGTRVFDVIGGIYR
jgi:hypothetical protein